MFFPDFGMHPKRPRQSPLKSPPLCAIKPRQLDWFSIFIIGWTSTSRPSTLACTDIFEAPQSRRTPLFRHGAPHGMRGRTTLRMCWAQFLLKRNGDGRRARWPMCPGCVARVRHCQHARCVLGTITHRQSFKGMGGGLDWGGAVFEGEGGAGSLKNKYICLKILQNCLWKQRCA